MVLASKAETREISRRTALLQRLLEPSWNIEGLVGCIVVTLYSGHIVIL